jgi:hypothetical protein
MVSKMKKSEELRCLSKFKHNQNSFIINPDSFQMTQTKKLA